MSPVVAFYCNFSMADGDLNQISPALLRQWNVTFIGMMFPELLSYHYRYNFAR